MARLSGAAARWIGTMTRLGMGMGRGKARLMGTVTLAAVRHFLVDVTGSLHAPLLRAARSIRGWKQLMPPMMRLPLPRAAVGAIDGAMLGMVVCGALPLYFPKALSKSYTVGRAVPIPSKRDNSATVLPSMG